MEQKLPEDLETQNELLRRENSRLLARLERLEGERQAFRRVGWLGAKVFIGRDLHHSFRAWAQRAASGDFPVNESADLAAAIVRRVIRVSMIGVFAAGIPIILLSWQNWELRKQSQLFTRQMELQTDQHSEAMDAQARQIEQQALQLEKQTEQHREGIETQILQMERYTVQHRESMDAQARQLEQQKTQLNSQEKDALIVRRAQLLATIYDCEEDGLDKKSTGRPGVDCRPKANPRAREEAIRAFAQIETERGVPIKLDRATMADLELGAIDFSSHYCPVEVLQMIP